MIDRVVLQRLNGIDELLAELRGLVGAGGGPTTAGPITTFVVDSTVVTPSGNVFTTLAQAVAAAAAVSGPKVFEMRGATSVIAAGTYNFGPDPYTIVGQFGLNGFFPPTCTIAAGVTFTGGGGNIIFDSLNIVAAVTAPLITATTPGSQVLFKNCQLRTTGGFSLVNAPAGIVVDVVLDGQTPTVAGGVLFDSIGAGSFMIVALNSASTIAANTVAQSGGGTTLVVTNNPSGAANLTQAGMPTGLLVTGSNYLVGSSTNNTKGPGGGSPAIQAGVATLVAGTQAAIIPATITATSRIVLGVKTPTPGAGNLTVEYAALGADRVTGLSGAGGGFKVTALIAAGTINVLDTSLVDYVIIN